MKLSEYKNEDALELLGDILEPLSDIMNDEDFKILIKTEKNKMKVVQYLLQKKGKSIIQILARLDGVPVEQYNKNIVQMANDLLDIVNDKELTDFFDLQSQSLIIPSGSATENTEETVGV